MNWAEYYYALSRMAANGIRVHASPGRAEMWLSSLPDSRSRRVRLMIARLREKGEV